MKKLIINMPRGKHDAKLLLTTAFALAHYRTTTALKYDEFKGESHDFNDYIVDLVCLEPDYVIPSPFAEPGTVEYEDDAGLIDGVLLRTLAQLQTLIAFEMHFENRGDKFGDKRQTDGDYYDNGEIYDDAIATLYYAEPATYAPREQVKEWNATAVKS